MTAAQLSVIFFIQMLVILIACRASAWFNQRFFGQPPVIGEIIAGVLLGPSLFGLLFPEWQQALFPKESLKVLYVGAQLGVGVYMFLVGMEFRADVFRNRARAAVSISIAGIVFPFCFALMLTQWLMDIPGLFSPKATYLDALLFLGAAISITSFPLVARIVTDRGLTGTPLGTLALSAGAVDDMVAWCLLAIVLASFGQGSATAFKAIVGGIAYVAVVLTIGRWLLAKLARQVEREGRLNNTMFGIILALLMAGVAFTDWIGIHAVFGGFVLGVAMPRGVLTRELWHKLEPIALAFLLPMFFAASGLATRLDMVSSGLYLFVAMVILAASIAGKGVACWAAARVNGVDNRTALAVGSLMNARGLLELIIANIGLQLGVIQPALFSMLALMTIVTTLMASPLFERYYGRYARANGELDPVAVKT